MLRTANVMVRVAPEVKAQAETVLSELGISMSTAMAMYLRQIALHKKIPFELGLPAAKKPISIEDLNDDQLGKMMDEAWASYKAGKCMDAADFRKQFSKEIGLLQKLHP